MAVFTNISEADAQQLLKEFNIGELVSLRGITAGIENTNYFLNTTQGEYVVTIFEVLKHGELPFYIELMHHLASKKLPVPQPQTTKNGSRITTLHGKPCSIVTRLDGGYEPNPGVKHCALAGKTLAQMHLAAQDYHLQQDNLRSLPWWQITIPKIEQFLDQSQLQLIKDSLNEQIEFTQSDLYANLQSGPAHCDLFRDNVLFAGTFEQPSMGGFIDFYFAGYDKWIFDVAVSVNDWCIHRQTGEFIPELYQSWLAAYNKVRPFTKHEIKSWPVILRAAALRFWTSRLYDYFVPREAHTLKPHDPRHFERILKLRSQSVPALIPNGL